MLRFGILFTSFLLLSGCATESHRVIREDPVPVTQVPAAHQARTTLMVGNFSNRSDYMNGIFSSGDDRLGNQARAILKSRLLKTGRFKVVDRENMQSLNREAAYSGAQQHVRGAQYVVAGAVTGFGRKEVGDKQLFGILGRGKEQIAYARVVVNIVDVRTSDIVYSAEGAGEYALSNREIVGFGGTAGYDATLNGKVLDLALGDAIQHLVRDYDAGKINF